MSSSDSGAIRAAAAPLLACLPHAAWLPHALVRKPNGDLDKPPCMGARTNAPETWFTLDAALAHLTGHNDVAGIGFAVTRGIITYDFDHCRDQFTGELDDEVLVELETLNSYAYVTPSRSGIRVVGTNDPGWPIPPGKFVRWLPGGHKIEIFVGPVNFYNTFTSEVIEGYDTLKDLSDCTLDRLQGLDAGKSGSNGPAIHTSNPDPQRSIAAIRAALAVIPNNEQNWDEWCRIGMAVWRSSGGRGEGLDAWHEWSKKHACYDPAACDERWEHWFISPPTKIGFGTLYHEARKIRPLFVPPFDEQRTERSQTDEEAPKENGVLPEILTMRQLDALPAPEWLVAGLIPERSLVVPFGPPKAGKTFVVLSWCLHVAAGKDWFGYSVKQGAVVYIAGEGTGGLSNRLRAMRRAYDISIDDPFFIVRRAVNFQDPAAVDGLLKAVRTVVGNLPIAILVLDTLARAMPGADENSAQEVGLVIAACDRARDELGCTVIPVHHSGKDIAKGARGTSALRGAWDTALEISGTGRQSVMTVVDQKEAEGGQRLVFRMDQVSVGIGRTSLVPVLVSDPVGDNTNDTDTPRREPVGQSLTALTVLRHLMAGPESAVLPPFSGLPSGDVRGVHYETWRRGFYEKMPGEPQPKRKLAFYRASQKLEQLGYVGVKDPWVWLTK